MTNTIATLDGSTAIDIDGTVNLEWSSGDSITWTVAIDLNDDGDFSDSNEDISADVMSFDWQLGFSAPYEAIARAATCNLTIRNDDKKYSPEYTASTIYPDFTRNKVVKITSTYGTTTTHFVGRIASISPAGNTLGSRTTSVYCAGFLQEAQDAEAFVPAQESKTADQVLEAIINHSNLHPPGLSGRWLLGVTNFSELGQSTTLGDISDILDAETGQTAFSMIGDKWIDGVSVFGAMRDTVGREGGRLFVDRNGKLVFWNRHHLPSKGVPDSVIDQTSITGMTYSYGDGVVNSVTVQANPRNIESTVSTLGQMDKAVQIKIGKSKSINFRFQSADDGAKIAGRNINAPQPTRNYQANNDRDGNGVDYTDLVTARLVDATATRAKVEFTNNAPFDLWILAGATIEGEKITDYGTFDQTAEDDTSIGDHRRQSFTYPFVMDDVDVAQSMADYLVDLWKDPTGRINSITVPAYQSDKTFSQAINRTIGDRITFIESQTAAGAIITATYDDTNAITIGNATNLEWTSSKDYFIIGEQFSFAGKMNLSVTWTLEPADNQKYWLLGISGFGELGTGTVIGPF